jgi:hypothetical protein
MNSHRICITPTPHAILWKLGEYDPSKLAAMKLFYVEQKYSLLQPIFVTPNESAEFIKLLYNIN